MWIFYKAMKWKWFCYTIITNPLIPRGLESPRFTKIVVILINCNFLIKLKQNICWNDEVLKVAGPPSLLPLEELIKIQV